MFNLLKGIKISSRRFKIFSLFLLTLLILIPVIVFAVATINNPRDGYDRLKNGATNGEPIFWNTGSNRSSISTSTTGVCVTNSTNEDYFVPTATLNEWNMFKANGLRAGLGIVDGVSNQPCIGDKNCNALGGEYCINAKVDCSGCVDFSCGGTFIDNRNQKFYPTATQNSKHVSALQI
jgi:hypothetical protein